MVVVSVALATLSAACSTSPRGPSRTLPLPEADERREALFRALGTRAFAVLQGTDASTLLLDDDGLRALLEPEAASRAALMRASTPPRIDPDSAALVADARYQGVCVQRARLEPAGPSLGLREPAFALDRLLVVARDPSGGRVAAWLEGSFVLTDRGLFAVALQRLEPPRRDHADLDLAVCDLRFGIDPPPGVVVHAVDSY